MSVERVFGVDNRVQVSPKTSPPYKWMMSSATVWSPSAASHEDNEENTDKQNTDHVQLAVSDTYSKVGKGVPP